MNFENTPIREMSTDEVNALSKTMNEFVDLMYPNYVKVLNVTLLSQLVISDDNNLDEVSLRVLYSLDVRYPKSVSFTEETEKLFKTSNSVFISMLNDNNIMSNYFSVASLIDTIITDKFSEYPSVSPSVKGSIASRVVACVGAAAVSISLIISITNVHFTYTMS